MGKGEGGARPEPGEKRRSLVSCLQRLLVSAASSSVSLLSDSSPVCVSYCLPTSASAHVSVSSFSSHGFSVDVTVYCLLSVFLFLIIFEVFIFVLVLL